MKNASVRPGAYFELEITGLDPEGNGTADEDGCRLIVPGAAPGDAVRVRVEHVSRHRSEAHTIVVDVIGRGVHYTEPGCAMAIQRGKSCGGCPTLHLPPETALQMKHRAVVDALGSRGIHLPVELQASPRSIGYRNRSNFVVARGRTGRPYLGSYRPHTHQVARMEGCPVLREPIARVTEEIAYVLHLSNTPVFPEKEGLRYVTLRSSQEGRVLVDLVVGERGVPWLAELADSLMRIREIDGVSFSVNAAEGNALRVAESRLLAGEATIKERVGQVEVLLMAASFSQLNSDVAGKMYEAAAAAVSGAKVVWDLYCGAGGLGLNALKRNPAMQLYGAESVEGTLNLARMAARQLNGKAHFEIVDLSETIPAWPAPDAILVNPPRRGLDQLVRDTLVAMTTPVQLVYMSCNPRSFADDAAALLESGWKLHNVRAWDMLPGTAHVELLGFFSKT